MRDLRLLALFIAAGAAAPLAAQQPRTIAVGQQVTGELTTADPVSRRRNAPYQVWTFDGRRGQRLTIDVISSEFDTYVTLRDDIGMSLGSDDDSGDEQNARLRTVLPRDGRYRVVVTAFSESGRGRYTLSLTGWEAPQVPAPGAITAIAAGESRQGMLEPGDSVAADGPYEDRWTVTARAGQRLRVDLSSTDFDSYLLLFGPDGAKLGQDDDGGEGTNASLGFRAATAGTYTIVATSLSDEPRAGVYGLSLTEETGVFADPGVAGAISSGETREGRLESGDVVGARGLEDRWTFTGRAGQVARVDVMSSAFDAYAYLRINEVAADSNDDGGDGNNSRLTTVLPTSGTYTIVVTTYSRSSTGGRYTVGLTVSDPPAGAGRVETIRAGQRLAGRLEAGDRPRGNGAYQDLWEFDGRTGQDVIVEMHSAEFDSYLELRGPDGSVIAENDDGGEGRDALIITRLRTNGRFRIVARSYGEAAATGFYDLSLSLGGEVARPGRVVDLRTDQVVLGRLEAGDSVVGDSTFADLFTFRAPQNGEVTFDLRSGDFDAYLIVKDARGMTLATDDDGGAGTDSRIVLRVEQGATYRVYANSYGEDRATGLYRLSVRYGGAR